MSYSSRFWLYAPLLMFLALTGFVSLHWWNAASALNRKLDAMKGHEAIPGIVIDWRSKNLSGFPFNIDLVLEGLSITGAGAHGSISWQTEKFATHSLSYGRPQQVLEGAGQQRLSWADADRGAHDLSFLPGSLHASAVFTGRELIRFDIDIVDAGGKNDGDAFTARRLQLHVRRDPGTDALDLVASADGVKTGTSVIAKPRITGTISPAKPFEGLLKGENGWPQAATQWRAQNGKARFDKSGLTTEQTAALEKLLSGFY
jgi:hypothetical protein